MIRHGTAPFLECSSKGEKRLSAFYARIPARGNRSIEDIYQGAKVFLDGSTGLNWRQAKGKMCANMDEVRALYSRLWDEYIDLHSDLQQLLCQASGTSDVFGQPNHACQATELWRIRNRLLTEHDKSIDESIVRYLGVIGTAGRDKAAPLNLALWNAMCEDFKLRLRPGDHLVSGGAAWADHLSVHAYLQGWCKALTLYLPAPFSPEHGFIQQFSGNARTAASAANYYHQCFKQKTGVDGIAQIAQAIEQGATVHSEPFGQGYGAMFARNKKVAKKVSAVVAYTFGSGERPADGGTNDTWNQIESADKVHVPLYSLIKPSSPTERQMPPDDMAAAVPRLSRLQALARRSSQR